MQHENKAGADYSNTVCLTVNWQAADKSHSQSSNRSSFIQIWPPDPSEHLAANGHDTSELSRRHGCPLLIPAEVSDKTISFQRIFSLCSPIFPLIRRSRKEFHDLGFGRRHHAKVQTCPFIRQSCPRFSVLAGAGYSELVHLLVERGARLDMKDILWQGTQAGWAQHAGKTEIEAYLRCSRASVVGEKNAQT
jgi:hypothetical protein